MWLPSLLLTLVIAAAVPGGVVIEGSLPDTPSPGSTSPVHIRIHKGGLDYFGRLLIEAPADCKLEADQLFGGQFRWDEQRNVAIISWLKLPDNPQFDIRLNLTVDDLAQPRADLLTWEFSFIRNNDRESVRPAPLNFRIVAQGEDTTSDLALPQSSAGTPSAQRHWSKSEANWHAEVDIEGLAPGGFAKLEIPLPPRCAVTVLDAGGSTVREEGGFLTFLWFDYDNKGPLRYQVAGCTLSEAQNSPSILSFIEDNQPGELTVIDAVEVDSDQMVSELNPAQLPDIQFEVQIAALKKHRVTDYFQQRLNFRHEVKEERVDDWVKYTHGSFSFYEEARVHRNLLRDEHSVEGPFVVGRREGKRISVQEALTRTGQNWTP